MPGGNGKGPRGKGPGTGRNLGPCSSNIPGQQNINQRQRQGQGTGPKILRKGSGQGAGWQRRIQQSRKP